MTPGLLFQASKSKYLAQSLSTEDNQLFHPPPNPAAHYFTSFYNGIIILAIGSVYSSIIEVKKLK